MNDPIGTHDIPFNDPGIDRPCGKLLRIVGIDGKAINSDDPGSVQAGKLIGSSDISISRIEPAHEIRRKLEPIDKVRRENSLQVDRLLLLDRGDSRILAEGQESVIGGNQAGKTRNRRRREL